MLYRYQDVKLSTDIPFLKGNYLFIFTNIEHNGYIFIYYRVYIAIT
jgi:hypothetical protein